MDSTYTKMKKAWRPNVARARRNLAAFVYSFPTKIWPSISTKSQENSQKKSQYPTKEMTTLLVVITLVCVVIKQRKLIGMMVSSIVPVCDKLLELGELKSIPKCIFLNSRTYSVNDSI